MSHVLRLVDAGIHRDAARRIASHRRWSRARGAFYWVGVLLLALGMVVVLAVTAALGLAWRAVRSVRLEHFETAALLLIPALPFLVAIACSLLWDWQ